MLELSNDINIIESIEAEAIKIDASIVEELTVEIGVLSGVVKEAVEFAMQEAVKGSSLQNTNIHSKLIPANV